MDSVPSVESEATSVPSEVSGHKDGFNSEEGRWGTREIEITNVTISGPDGETGHVFQSGDAIHVRMEEFAPWHGS